MRPSTEPTEFLTVKEVAARLRISKSTAYQLIKAQILSAHVTGCGPVRPRGYRVPAIEVDRYLSQTCTSEIHPTTSEVA